MWPSTMTVQAAAVLAVAGWVCVLLAAAADSEVILNGKVGDKVVLQPNTPKTVTIKSIVWKHDNNLAMQFDGQSIDGYRQFELRGSLNSSSGEMTITGLTRDDSGSYTGEINDVTGTPIRLNVYPPVPKPSISRTCDEEGSSCVLTCDGDTMDAEPVTYEWRSGDRVLTDNTKEKKITKENSSGMDEFSCELVNPVSRESSPVITNPLTKAPPDTSTPSNLKISTGLTVFISMLSAVVLLVLVHRWKAGSWFFQQESMPWEADFWSNKRPSETREAVESNGAARQEKTDEETPMT
ncbi:CD48 antigen BCM1 surface antigen BLAST-1 HM48-1 MRC OX-45 surface antigen SLAM family member 2 [Collichthys lucidus]|uniref:CD48 antigen BCM1 surface antigen BLAST-1 HM48-1 MRC OX-45 surface antigen SLAM family member 2 n=1 Tax=Collichthys lucidus TaxID=240159 RepID=A0A4U5TXX3_COLLU|nr:CD48 antigen BCM1 surface antigen BLAST-1 HM48-1 MRC OX-45 surface antigen SLAM family member 2 [Collichthys lucidus]